ncbi:hypothetical protein DNL40_08085 [Xylanimonas oleitrophica]|uniref:HTH luxR-type domain-containing protein n=1 Tax=Xylanimonas oleitrophica TaxID=2607479 RepID=A0A2W5WZT7_9MICO|nr:LuxR family transcriptional regulator [Xylanimonas oleitrophica]PZR53455.1 hypothetical protein DNL40_08085 [Xylanimonas oleitrophica]
MTLSGTLHVDVRDDAVRHLMAGRSVDLQGLPGSGRTLLAQAVADELEDAGWHVVRVHGVLALRERPLEALAIAGLVARQGSQATTAVSAAVQGILAAVRGGRALLVVDDEVDLDETSIGAIVAAHQIAPFPLLSTSYPKPRAMRRPYRVPAEVQPGVTLQVPPLGFVDTQTLLVDALGGPIDAATVSRVFAASGGLPGLALALAEGARQHGGLRQVDGVWQAGPDMWTPEMVRSVDPLLQRLSPPAIDGLHALALAGTVDVSTARRLMSWEVLEELDGYRLLRFVPRGDEMLVGVFPLGIVEYFRHLGVGARHLKVDEAVTRAFGGSLADRPSATATPWQLTPEASAAGTSMESDTIVNRLLLEHWHRELLLRRSEWEQTPSPRTAAPLLRTMLVTGAGPQAVRTVLAGTPRTGDRRDLVTFDVWYALFVGTTERDLRQVHEVLDRTRLEADEWVWLVDGIEAFLTLMVEHAPDPADLTLPVPGTAPSDTVQVVGTVRAELLLARGRSAEARALFEELGEPTTPFAQVRAASRSWALLMEGRLEEALERAQDQLQAARRVHDVEGIVGAAYVVAQVLLTWGRTTELRNLLGSVLSAGVLPALERSQQVALLSIAADLAQQEGRTTTARTLAQQALALRTGPGPYPLGSPTLALARLDSEGRPPAEARALAATRLWDEAQALLAHGYLVSGYTAGMLAMMEEPTSERAQVLRQTAALVPAPIIGRFQEFVDALAAEDPERLVDEAHALADAGLVAQATAAYSAATRLLRTAGRAGRAAEVHDAARRRLAPWGADALAGLRSAAEAAELTAREDEIARLAAAGLSNQDIARRLLISVRTVENHLHRVFRKLGVDNRSELSRVLAV